MEFNELKNLFEQELNNNKSKCFNNVKTLVSSFSRNRKYIPHIVNNTNFIDTIFNPDSRNPVVPMSMRIYCILNDIDTIDKLPKCTCGKLKTFNNIISGFKLSCGNKMCYQKLDEVNKKRQSTTIDKYGSLKKAYHDTAKLTIQEKYGVDNISELDDIKQKKIETSRKNWGTDYPWQSDEGKRLHKEGVIDKYGVDNISKLDNIKQQKIETCRNNFGYDNPFQVPEIKKKIEDRWNSLYGVRNISQVLEIQMKKANTVSKEYITPNNNTVIYHGNENILLDYLYSKYNESNIYTQPKIRIPYIDNDSTIHFWFPDVLIDLNDIKIIIEGKDYNSILKYYERSSLTRYKIIGGVNNNYITQLYIYHNINNINELYMLQLSIDNCIENWTITPIYNSKTLLSNIINRLKELEFNNIIVVN